MTIRTPLSIVALAASLLAFAAPSFATNYGNCDPNYPSQCDSPLGDNTYNLVTHGVTPGTNSGVSGAVNVNNVNIAVSSWSDTHSLTQNPNTDDVVVGANLHKISNRSGYGVYNQDENNNYNGVNHAFDNAVWNQNYNSEGRKYADFDFVLISFSEAVTMTGANFGWAVDDSHVSVAALDDISLLTSGVNTWSDITGAALAKNSFDIEECDTGYTSAFSFTQSAQYWLVGAYNVAFGDITNGQTFNDAFKLTAVGFNKNSPNTPSQVSAPGTLGLFLLSGVAVALRRKQRS